MAAVLMMLAAPSVSAQANTTTPGAAAAAAGTCTTATVTATFTGDANNNGWFTVAYGPSAVGPWTSFAGQASGPSPRQIVVTGLTASASYWFQVTFSDPDGILGTNPIVTGSSIMTPACGADTVAPTITMLVPTAGALISGVDTMKAQVYDASGTARLAVQYQLDSTAGAWTAMAADGIYPACGTNCATYTATLASAPAAGMHYIAVRAADAAGNATVVATGFTATASGTGTGTLLRRTHGSELCVDCHALETHNSQFTSTKYGSWSFDCLGCHTPHKTTNIYLVRPQINTPSSGTKSVSFWNTAGVAANSFATPTASGNGVNVCEVCHTKTKNSDGTPRARNGAATDWTKHYTSNCVGCHSHAKGFAAGESDGGATCAGCHTTIWSKMQAAGGSAYKHTLAVDTFSDDPVAWVSPLNANANSVRSCVNMCHDDHPHTAADDAAPTLHYNLVYDDAATSASRAAATRTVATKAKTDFSAASANGGLCLSCHKNPVESGPSPAHPSVDKVAYAASAHNTTSTTPGGAWQFTLHDGSNFARNCTKCHWDTADGTTPAVTGITGVGSVHGGPNPSLLMGTTNPNGTPGSFICYRCHGNGTTGQNYSAKDIATQIAKTRAHPSNADNVHNTVTEASNAAFGNTLGVTGRHANCLDCHETHKAKAGTHATPGNLAGPPIEGAWGAQLSSSPAFWSAPAAANFTKKTIVAGTDLEATLCFKCHSAFYGPLPTSPSGGFTETDTAREFNPNNTNSGSNYGSFHPVLAPAGSNLGATSNILAPWTRASTMTCTDCHESNSTADPNGPHGSTANFLLKGPNTKWDATVGGTTSGMPAGTFCANCHSASFAGSRFPRHTYDKHTTNPPGGGTIKCFNCHGAIPHGTARPGLLVCPPSSGSVNGVLATDAAPYLQLPAGNFGLRIVSYPSNNTTAWSQNNCGCGNDGWGH